MRVNTAPQKTELKNMKGAGEIAERMTCMFEPVNLVPSMARTHSSTAEWVMCCDQAGAAPHHRPKCQTISLHSQAK